MDTITATIQLPVELYTEIEKFAAKDQNDLNALLVSLLRQAVEARKWREGWRELRNMVQRDNGSSVGMTKEEIVEQMRKTRQEVFETEYAHLYR